jgi:hypothetical protein
MASYTVQLTPSLINLASEGSLDTSVVSGISIQRTAYVELVNSSGGRKVYEAIDGETIDDVVQDPTDYSNGAGGNWLV